MAWVSVRHNLDAVTKGLQTFAREEVPFAEALALTWTAQDAQSGVQDSLARRFTLRNNRVRTGIRITAARKSAPTSIVGSIDDFMKLQETGGTKSARDHSRVAIPADVKRTKRDLIGKSQRPLAMRGKPKVLSWHGVDIFRRGGTAAILQRVGKGRYPLKALWRLKPNVRIKPRLGFKATTMDIIGRRIGPNFIRALSQASASSGASSSTTSSMRNAIST